MKKGIVCIIDVLGTKGVSESSNFKAHVSKLKRIDNFIASMVSGFKRVDQGNSKIKYLRFSDTYIIIVEFRNYKEPDFSTALPFFCQLLQSVFTQFLAESLVPRGAISAGEFFQWKTSLIGPAVDDAAYYHDAFQNPGIFLTPHTSFLLDYAKGMDTIKMLDMDTIVSAIKFKAPLKNNQEIELNQVNWPKIFFDAKPRQGESFLKSLLAARPIPITAYSKYEYMLEFFNHSFSEGERLGYLK